jgi:hypothetical protein
MAPMRCPGFVTRRNSLRSVQFSGLELRIWGLTCVDMSEDA